MSGFSSGGHLSSLVATTCGLKEGKSGSVTVDLEGDLGSFTSFSSCIDAATLWSPPTDIYTMNPINNFMGSGTYEGAFIGAEREGNSLLENRMQKTRSFGDRVCVLCVRLILSISHFSLFSIHRVSQIFLEVTIDVNFCEFVKIIIEYVDKAGIVCVAPNIVIS
jgi:hypothetical protein